MKKRNILFLSISFLFLSNFLIAKEIKRLDEVTITAQKTEENVQKVPMTVNVLNDVLVEDSSIKYTKDISSYIPNLITLNSGSREYFSRLLMRGISNTGIGDPAVALYIDDIPYDDIYAFNSPILDIERIEVLKGPQGTLYGKNTEAGVINIITKQASDIFEGRLNLEAGNYNDRQGMLNINIPIVKDKLFVKLSALKSKKDGYIKNLYNSKKIDNQRTETLNINTLFKSNDNLDINLILGLTKFDDDGGFPMSSIDKESYKKTLEIKNLDDFEVSYDYEGRSKSDTKISMLKFKYFNEKFDFTSITGYRKMKNNSTLDADFSPRKYYIGFNDRKTDSINQEFRVSSSSTKSFKWIIGTFFSKKDLKHGTGYSFAEDIAKQYNLPLYSEDKISADLESKDIAVFGQSTIRFFNDALGITGGLRYEKSKREMNNRKHTMNQNNVVPVISGLEKNYSKLLPKLTFDYYLNKNFMIYSTFSKGYKAGGFSYAVDKEKLAQYDPEITKSIEVGFKSFFPEQRLVLNFATFLTKVDDYQDRVQVDKTTIIQSNATEVDIKGFEIESAFELNDNFTFSANLGFTDAKYGKYINPITKENYKDKRVTFLPEYDLNLGIKYRNNFGFLSNIEMQNVGDRYFDRANNKKIKAYNIYNMKIGYEQENWDINFIIKNITNKEYFLDGFNDPGLGIGYIGTVGEPRIFKLAYNLRF